MDVGNDIVYQYCVVHSTQIDIDIYTIYLNNLTRCSLGRDAQKRIVYIQMNEFLYSFLV